MSKLKCRGCGDRFQRDSMLQLAGSNYHSFDCAAAYATEKQQKARERQLLKAKQADKKKHAKRKREFYENDVKTRATAARTACHAYINFRDRGSHCICCGREITGNPHAGHFLESGNNPIIRYNEDNIHSQSSYCNMYQGGNSDDYEGRLRLKIGDKRVDYLLANKGGTMKRTAQDYKEIEDYYKGKLKALQGYNYE